MPRLLAPELSAAVVTTFPLRELSGRVNGPEGRRLEPLPIAADSPASRNIDDDRAVPNQPDGRGLMGFLLAPPSIAEIWSGAIPSSWCGGELLSHLTLARACWLVDAQQQQTPKTSPSRSQGACWRFSATMRTQTAHQTTHLLYSSPYQASSRPLARVRGMLT